MKYEEDVTKFDPEQKYLYEMLPEYRKSFDDYPKEIADKAHTILDILEHKGDICVLSESVDWLLCNVTSEKIGEDRFIGEWR